MEKARNEAEVRHFAECHGVITRHQALALGFSEPLIDYRLRSGRWEAIHRGVYHRRGEKLTPEGRLLAACYAFGREAVASHAAGAWLWGLLPGPPPHPVVTAPRSAARAHPDIRVRRRDELDSSERTQRRGIPVTTPVRTLCDLGEDEDLPIVEQATDAALARGLVTADKLSEALDRAASSGRRGVRVLRASLEERGVVGAPDPSVLESRVARLLKSWGVAPLGAEVVVAGGAYRVDFMLASRLILEADGFAFHSSPAAKAADDHRRNQLQLQGFVVLHTNWVEVTRHPERLQATVLAALTPNGWPVGGRPGQ